MAQVLGRSATTIADDSLALRALGMSRNHLGLATGFSHVVSALVACRFSSGWRFCSRFGSRSGSADGSTPTWATTWTGPWSARVSSPSSSQPFSPVFSSVEGRLANVLRADVLPPHQEPSVGRHLSPSGWARSMAFEPGRGRRRVPVVPALLAATIAVAGVVASLCIDSGISSALAHPELAGVTWDATRHAQHSRPRLGAM